MTNQSTNPTTMRTRKRPSHGKATSAVTMRRSWYSLAVSVVLLSSLSFPNVPTVQAANYDDAYFNDGYNNNQYNAYNYNNAQNNDDANANQGDDAYQA
eukprot:CAMPEP_0172454928 /NCGR_PEP_ID=MMETSP1065-20121228/11773_1 /TAXON_ID=265537 /ORGANISM="Amphiprora paludosa, Strain CCMP125" /LENGTH=97 /DNA_ID=CAMNT_0013207343 /DNA_START=103 /DNA_END=392 /DNA_ORIENTATION=+